MGSQPTSPMLWGGNIFIYLNHVFKGYLLRVIPHRFIVRLVVTTVNIFLFQDIWHVEDIIIVIFF